MDTTVFIAGKISGLPLSVAKEKFKTLETKLCAIGYHVVKPFALVDQSQTWEGAIKKDIRRMLECDELHLSADWQESRGSLSLDKCFNCYYGPSLYAMVHFL